MTHMKQIFLMLVLFGILSVSCSRTTSLTVRGKLSIGHEVSSFIPCGDTTDYWVDDQTGELDSLYKTVVGEKSEPYAPVYVELKVNKVDLPTEGFAAEYDGMYEVVEIIKVEPIEGNSNCK